MNPKDLDDRDGLVPDGDDIESEEAQLLRDLRGDDDEFTPDDGPSFEDDPFEDDEEDDDDGFDGEPWEAIEEWEEEDD
jgi:hypothetical protein